MGGLFKKPDIKKPEPVRMPDTEDPEAREAAERRRRQIAARSGRSSTMLSQRSSSGAGAGTDSYKNSLLGQAG